MNKRRRGYFKNLWNLRNNKIWQWLLLGMAVLGLVVLVNKIQEVQRWWSEATGERAHLVVNMRQEVGGLSPVWQGVSQGLEGDETMLEPVGAAIKELGVRLVRVDHVLSNYGLVSREGSQLVFNFTRLDRLVQSITKAGAIPVLALSYMPVEMSENGSVTGSPRSWTEWEQLVRAAVSHYSGRNDLALEGVYYEVWNEPDLYGYWKIDRGKSYLELYEHTARAVQNLDNVRVFYLGGPGTTGMYPNWIKALGKAARDKGWKLDFVSWHRYSKSVGDFDDDARWVREWLDDEGLSNVQLVISEWGINAELDEGYDGRLAAAHGVAVVRELVDVTDHLWAFELKDGLDPQGKTTWGRWGMLTHEQKGLQKKPRFEAWKMLNELVGSHTSSSAELRVSSQEEKAERLLVLGEGSWVTGLAVRTEGGFKLILTNYDQFGRHFEWVPIDVLGFEPGDYEWRLVRLDGRQESGVAEVPSGIWRTNIYLGPNEVGLLEMVRQKQ